MTQFNDWNRCNELWGDHMYYQAADQGYDHAAGDRAHTAWLKAITEYHEKYGVYWDAHAKPETTILEDAALLRDMAQAFVASIEKPEEKSYGQVVKEWLDERRAVAIAKRSEAALKESAEA